jgi:GrpB-like predicted nucleotidyltransferase (UPF0157 family)
VILMSVLRISFSGSSGTMRQSRKLVAQTEREVINFGESWKETNARRKREIQSALFLEGLVTTKNASF